MKPVNPSFLSQRLRHFSICTCCILLPIVLASKGWAQDNTYLKDLEALRSMLQKTPSYKAQVKGKKRHDYEALYRELQKDTIASLNSYQYFYRLSQLFFPLRDNHLALNQLYAEQPDTNRQQKQRDPFDAAIWSNPYYPIDTDSLGRALALRSADSIEGIYHYGQFYSIGLFRTKVNELTGVVLESAVPNWAKGQIALRLYEYAPNRYQGIYAHPRYNNLLLQNNETYLNQSLANSFFYVSYSDDIYRKQLNAVDHVNLPRNGEPFTLRSIAPEVQYLAIRSFQADQSTSRQSKRFYDSIRNQLNAPHLVLDLRNNAGGAKKEAKKYFHLLKRYTRKGKLHVLQNNGTLSQGERFLLKVKKLKGMTSYGQPTKGMIAYGSNYGRKVQLPSGRFEVYLTDMKGPRKLLAYEGIGIAPDITLTADNNWLEQVMGYIRK